MQIERTKNLKKKKKGNVDLKVGTLTIIKKSAIRIKIENIGIAIDVVGTESEKVKIVGGGLLEIVVENAREKKGEDTEVKNVC